MRTRLKSPDLYSIGWIAALPIERAAATALLDERHDEPEEFCQDQSDSNSYTWGRIGIHNIVIASLPAGVYGTTSAATTATDLVRSFTNIRIGLLVGIGGGVPRPDLDVDIRLGDVVVGQPDGTTGGVVQYDFGKAMTNGTWERKGSLNKPPPVLLHALSALQSEHEFAFSKVPSILQNMWDTNPRMRAPKTDFTYQGAKKDRLFEPDYTHVSGNCCDKCDPSGEVVRVQRYSTDPEIHYGVIASGNTLIKDAATRDSLALATGHKCLCVEMEAAGLMDRFPCLVIRGICDYADSHKNDQWQRYAAATAAAVAAELLEYIPASQLTKTQTVVEAMELLDKKMDTLRTSIQAFDHNIALDMLPVADGASFDSYAEEGNPTCLADTRVDLLSEIADWIKSHDSKPIFWLNGMAGTGKSTISRTVARSRSECRDLGGSFFFKKGETDRANLSKFVTTLARQLAGAVPTLGRLIKAVIDADRTIINKAVSTQFKELIEGPLLQLAKNSVQLTALVIVIDALDECERDDEIRLLIHILSHSASILPHLRVFLTSRPELPIRLGFGKVKGTYQGLVLHDMPAMIVEQDISTFLAEEFRKIRDDFNVIVNEERKLPTEWPGDAILGKLTKMAVPLFIFAATVCRFVGDRRYHGPLMQLHKILDHSTKSKGSQLDLTYGPVLQSQIIGASDETCKEIIDEFRAVVGGIIILANPLSVTALSQLLNISPAVIDARLDALHSVLNVPQSRQLPIRLLHLSFRDYLIDPRLRLINDFWVDEKLTHLKLAKDCLRIMSDSLKENICSLSFPGMERSDVDPPHIEKCLPPELQYACLYWVHHQTSIEHVMEIKLQTQDFLMSHFLHWLEAMSLMGHLEDCIKMIQSLANWFQEEDCEELLNLTNDAIRFVRASFTMIDEAPLQIYSSALAFSPSRSIIRRLYENKIPSWLALPPQVPEEWDDCLLVLGGHSGAVRAVAFSHDSTMLASASSDKTVRIYNISTGHCELSLEGHGAGVTSAAFSRDSKMLASSSEDMTIRIWNPQTGDLFQIMEGHEDFVKSVVFSHDSEILASVSRDKTVWIWKTRTEKCIRILKGHSDDVLSVAFSHESTELVSASYDMTIRIWNIETGKCMHLLKGHKHYVNSVAFSHDSKIIASASSDKTIRLWCAQTGECIKVLYAHTDAVETVAFSCHSNQLVSASRDKTVRIWNTQTAICEKVLIGHTSPVLSAVFSPNSTMAASGSTDQTVRIWNLALESSNQTLESHKRYISSMVLSHDLKMVASTCDNEIRLWNVQSGKCLQVLEHADQITSLVFSHDSNQLATCSDDDETARIWNTYTGECIQVLPRRDKYFTSINFSHDSKLVVLGSDHNTLRIRNVETGNCEAGLKDSENVFFKAVFSHNSEFMATASNDCTVRIWDINSGVCKRVLEGHTRVISVVVFSYDSQRVASASVDKTVRIWNIATGNCEQVLEVHTDTIDSVVFSHDSKIVVSASYLGTIHVWNTWTGECQSVISTESEVKVLSFTPDNNNLVTDNGVIGLTDHTWNSFSVLKFMLRGYGWVTYKGKKLLGLPVECHNAEIVVADNTVAIGCRSGRIIIMRLCDPATVTTGGRKRKAQAWEIEDR